MKNMQQGNKTGHITDSLEFIRSNPLSNPLSEMILVHELIKMNQEMISKYPSLDEVLKTIASIIDRDLDE